MRGTFYRLFGFVVWRALKWYLATLIPSRRRIVLSIAAVFAGAAVAGAVLRRLAD
ncbi:MAG TPA: hypothetical protein VMI13_06640 [Solirubrobacteraceae bacterium]|nr:hypothetical protein [Solirubrobacteraceae bacterium]